MGKSGAAYLLTWLVALVTAGNVCAFPPKGLVTACSKRSSTVVCPSSSSPDNKNKDGISHHADADASPAHVCSSSSSPDNQGGISDHAVTSSIVSKFPPARQISRRGAISSALAFATAGLLSTTQGEEGQANAAPPMAVIAEELGYFPVTNRNGDTMYIPGRVKRTSTDQSVELAKYLEKSGVTMYGAYWCPHCSRQKEMFGREAWSYINYVECSPKGYNADVKTCSKNDIEGFPTWKIGKKEIGSGEMTLDRIAEMSGYKGKFDGSLEEPLPMMGGGSCQ